jgi:hypothetical protein
VERAADASRQLGDSKNLSRLLEEISGQWHLSRNLTIEIAKSADFICGKQGL